MLKISVAGIHIAIENRFPFLQHHCREYLASFDVPDVTVSVTEEEIKAEREASPHAASDGYYESICAYRQIALALPRFDAMVFHASVVEYEGKAFAFAAHSGTGKSTHTKLWLDVFGDRARVINGDKPIFRRIDGVWHVFGTPWKGKEGWGSPISAPLTALCFLERGEENRIAPLPMEETVTRLFSQVLLPTDREMAEKQLALLDLLVGEAPSYLLHCNMSPEAALVAKNGMEEKKKE